MENFLAPTVLGNVISGIFAIIVAIIAKRKVDNPGIANKPEKEYRIYWGWIAAGIAGVATFVVASLLVNLLTPGPEINFSNPGEGMSIEVTIIETGSGSFQVTGTSKRIADNSDWNVFVLLHPADPFAEGWWIQPAVTMNTDGQWSGIAWIGDTDNKPEPGDTISLVAIVSELNRAQVPTKINDFSQISPITRSAIVNVVIGTTN
ncbi:MAG: hypothetical protein CL608_09360 [Anaerolineaceae bacterium]|nr:hypothetical protein [Anaerolineaceae bacterium]